MARDIKNMRNDPARKSLRLIQRLLQKMGQPCAAQPLRHLPWFNIALIAALGGLYIFTGDRWAWSEYFTIWPSFLWLCGLLPLVLMTWDRRRLRWFCVQGALLIAFVLSTTEWQSVVRWPDTAAIERWEAIRASEHSGRALRVVTWNLSGQSWASPAVCKKLAPLDPDLCFFQETRDDESAEDDGRPTMWRGWHWLDGGDCGLLSRLPVRALPTKRIGPWSPPQMALVNLGEGRELLAINVRLMLPSLVLNPLTRRNRTRLSEDHQARKSQYPALAGLIEETQAEHAVDDALLAGDFNTSASRYSLRPLRQWLTDAWRIKGRGWGRTMTNEFPVARIDQVWITPGIEAIDGRVVEGSPSDHRLVVMDLIVSPN